MCGLSKLWPLSGGQLIQFEAEEDEEEEGEESIVVKLILLKTIFCFLVHLFVSMHIDKKKQNKRKETQTNKKRNNKTNKKLRCKKSKLCW